MSVPQRTPRLPMRDGVSASVVAVPAGCRLNVLDFLAQRLPSVAREEWAARLQQGLVLLSDGQSALPEQPCPAGQHLHYYRHWPSEPTLPEPALVVFEDAHLLVADKPHFMPVTPTGRYVQQSLLVQLKRQTDGPDLTPIHRIDRETAGLVVLSKRPQDRDAYQALFRLRQVHKTYHAVAAHRPECPLPPVRISRLTEDPDQFFRMSEVAGQPNSETHIRLLRTQGLRALYELKPVTGKRHQLRVHMWGLGLPIEGDQFYPRVVRGPDDAEDFQTPLQLLAQALHFTDPVTGQARSWRSSLALSISPD